MPPPGDMAPDDAVDVFITKGDLPALAVAILDGGQTLYTKVAGIRKRGDATPVADDDAFHIGSNTKGMTALIAGTVVDQGLLTWDSTVGDVLSGTVDVGNYSAVTLAQLLSHSSGIPEVPTDVELAIDAEKMPVVAAQRREAAAAALAQPPSSAAGTSFLYSSGNFVIAGLMLEVATNTSWEDLMTQRLFVPLAMTHAGFGLPGTPGNVDAPWGHEPAPVDPGTPDIAPGFGPAGTVHASLGDLIAYAQLYLNDGVGPTGRIISDSALTEMETPRLGNYGLGWFVPTNAGVKRVAHSGSNRRFYSLMILFPERKAAMLMLTNDGTQQAWDRVDQVANYFSAHFGLPPKIHSADAN